MFYDPLLIAAAHAQLGEHEAAGKALRDLLRLMPDYAAIAREDLGKFWNPDLVEHYVDGLRKVGLDIAGFPLLRTT